jgi:hypothetical protein
LPLQNYQKFYSELQNPTSCTTQSYIQLLVLTRYKYLGVIALWVLYKHKWLSAGLCVSLFYFVKHTCITCMRIKNSLSFPSIFIATSWFSIYSQIYLHVAQHRNSMFLSPYSVLRNHMETKWILKSNSGDLIPIFPIYAWSYIYPRRGKYCRFGNQGLNLWVRQPISIVIFCYLFQSGSPKQIWWLHKVGLFQSDCFQCFFSYTYICLAVLQWVI